MTDRREAEPSPWYADGLRWQCTVCGQCCRNHGSAYRYVFSTVKEREAIAESMGISRRTFERRYCERDGGGLTFRSQGDACIFLSAGNLCTIYKHRPSQCSTFPFWPDLLVDRETWSKEIGDFCPGVDTGPLHDLETIRKLMDECDP